ncbi:MAG TPA: hypothetical protein VF085_03290 [Solirubrobacterales bacterium]
MSSSQNDLGRRGGGVARLGTLAAAMFAALALLFAMSATASASVGFYMGGKKSEEAAKQPKFEAEKYPAVVEGYASAPHRFTVNIGYVECDEVEFREFSGKMTKATSEMVFQPWHWLCEGKQGGLSIPIAFKAQGCEFALSALNVGPPYAGQFGIKCPLGSPGFEIVTYTNFEMTTPLCKVLYPPQTGVEGVSYENVGTGSARAVETSLELSGLKYIETGSKFFCKPGEFTNGALTGGEHLYGVE